MPKVNTILNYFSSPKAVKKPEPKKEEREKSQTPKREQKNKERVKNGRGKENQNTDDRKRLHKDDQDDEEDKSIKPKRRRLIIPDVESGDDSGDEFKPGTESDESESASEGDSEHEPETETEEETPEKKRKISNVRSKPRQPSRSKYNTKANKKEPKQATQTPSQVVSNGSTTATPTWPHLKLDFLQPEKIKDMQRRTSKDPDYDSKTVYVPHDFLLNQTPAMRQWWELKSKHFDCVLFFKVGKFYELYHMDAVIGVNELSLTYMRGEFAHSGFPEIGYGRYSASLIERGYKVARVEQTENPEMMAVRCTKMSGKPTKFDKVVKREICQVSTRGTRVYTPLDVEASTPNSNYLLALVEKCNLDSTISSFGVCFIDTTIGEFYLGQFDDDRCNSRLLTLLAHHPPVHVIYERGNLSPKTLQIINNTLPVALKEPLQRETQFWSAVTTLKKLHEEDYFKKEKDSNFAWPEGLKPYLNEGDSLGLTPADNKELAVNALGGCVYLLKEYLLEQRLLAQGCFNTYCPPDFSAASNRAGLNYANTMVIDAITIKNLRIFGEGSLNSVLDRCCTAFGKRLLREWICRPSCRKAVILERQQAVEELVDRIDVMQSARAILTTLPDLERLLSKIHAQGNPRMKNHPDGRAIMFEGSTYSKRVIIDFTTTLAKFEDILKFIELFDDFKSNLIIRCTQYEPNGEFPRLREILDYFKTAFDHEEAKKQGCIVPKKGVDAEYDSVLTELAQNKENLDQYLQKQKQHFGVKITFHGTDRKRYQIEVPESQVKKVGPGYELQSQRKGFKRYYTAEAKELLARQINAEEHRDKVLKDLNRRIFAQFSENYDTWHMAVYKLATMDVLISLADYARNGDMCVPEIYEGSDGEIFVEIRDGKHPCIMSDNFIPNDTLLAIGDAASFMILTGPNMGGKSTLMRQVGLITIMAQLGSYVPASSCRITLVDRIFTRLGANDDILAGQSTFLVELSETATILQHATPYSLVLLDELGRGTSTYDGTAIAASVVDALTKLKCRTLFSTHYHSLVEDYKTNKEVTLTHMACMVETEEEEEVSQETVTFLYKLSEGACPKSYGFNAARLAGVSSVITKRAHEIASKMEQETNHKHIFSALCRANTAAEMRGLIVTLNKLSCSRI